MKWYPEYGRFLVAWYISTMALFVGVLFSTPSVIDTLWSTLISHSVDSLLWGIMYLVWEGPRIIDTSWDTECVERMTYWMFICWMAVPDGWSVTDFLGRPMGPMLIATLAAGPVYTTLGKWCHIVPERYLMIMRIAYGVSIYSSTQSIRPSRIDLFIDLTKDMLQKDDMGTLAMAKSIYEQGAFRRQLAALCFCIPLTIWTIRFKRHFVLDRAPPSISDPQENRVGEKAVEWRRIYDLVQRTHSTIHQLRQHGIVLASPTSHTGLPEPHELLGDFRWKTVPSLSSSSTSTLSSTLTTVDTSGGLVQQRLRSEVKQLAKEFETVAETVPELMCYLDIHAHIGKCDAGRILGSFHLGLIIAQYAQSATRETIQPWSMATWYRFRTYRALVLLLEDSMMCIPSHTKLSEKASTTSETVETKSLLVMDTSDAKRSGTIPKIDSSSSFSSTPCSTSPVWSSFSSSPSPSSSTSSSASSSSSSSSPSLPGIGRIKNTCARQRRIRRHSSKKKRVGEPAKASLVVSVTDMDRPEQSPLEQVIDELLWVDTYSIGVHSVKYPDVPGLISHEPLLEAMLYLLTRWNITDMDHAQLHRQLDLLQCIRIDIGGDDVPNPIRQRCQRFFQGHQHGLDMSATAVEVSAQCARARIWLRLGSVERACNIYESVEHRVTLDADSIKECFGVCLALMDEIPDALENLPAPDVSQGFAEVQLQTMRWERTRQAYELASDIRQKQRLGTWSARMAWGRVRSGDLSSFIPPDIEDLVHLCEHCRRSEVPPRP